MLNWYVARTQPRKEKVARINLANQSIDTFLPCFWKTQLRVQSLENKLCPLFPGYIFFRSDEDLALWRAVGGTLGVSHVVWGYGRRPRPVPSAFMASLLGSCVDGILAIGGGDLAIGDCVKVHRGPFAGLLGTISSFGHAERVALFLDVMGGVTTIMNATDLERGA